MFVVNVTWGFTSIQPILQRIFLIFVQSFKVWCVSYSTDKATVLLFYASSRFIFHSSRFYIEQKLKICWNQFDKLSVVIFFWCCDESEIIIMSIIQSQTFEKEKCTGKNRTPKLRSINQSITFNCVGEIAAIIVWLGLS